MPSSARRQPFDEETRAALPAFLERLPNPVRVHVWGEPTASTGEREAARLVRSLADQFAQIELTLLPRRANYSYYPVLGIMGVDGEEPVDYGVRLIGLPAGVQMTSLIAAIQAVSFRGATLEARTRLQLRGLQTDVQLELLSAASDEGGTVAAKTIFGLAVASEHVRSFLIMADVFPEVLWRYSVRHVPHLVINGRFHVDGDMSEQALLQQLASALS